MLTAVQGCGLPGTYLTVAFCALVAGVVGLHMASGETQQLQVTLTWESCKRAGSKPFLLTNISICLPAHTTGIPRYMYYLTICQFSVALEPHRLAFSMFCISGAIRRVREVVPATCHHHSPQWHCTQSAHASKQLSPPVTIRSVRTCHRRCYPSWTCPVEMRSCGLCGCSSIR